MMFYVKKKRQHINDIIEEMAERYAKEMAKRIKEQKENAKRIHRGTVKAQIRKFGNTGSISANKKEKMRMLKETGKLKTTRKGISVSFKEDDPEKLYQRLKNEFLLMMKSNTILPSKRRR